MAEAEILVVGGGAIGGTTAALLAGRAGRVAVLEANAEHAARMRDPGLLLDDLGTERRVRLEAHADPGELDGPFDFALVTVKAPHLEAALAPLVERRLARAYVSLGNGLVQERVARLVGEENLVIGTVEWGATNLGPGRLARTTRAPFVIGEPDGRVRERTERLAAALGTAFEVRLTNNIRGQVWTKLLVNSTFSGLGAVSGLLYREVVASPAGMAAALALWREGWEVGRAQGLRLERFVGVPAGEIAAGGRRGEEAVREVMRHVGATKASMLQDLERGLKTEVDVINGAVVEKGREHGVPTPLNERVLELVRKMERGGGSPSPGALDELADLAGRTL
ncbi:2-dehydropantoate 2-reductase [Rubrobacter xylanophilus DSM 9941]|uniref:2-dehydropantoate 2-reductase n=1 Tax=Rubrobacter xylanophilus (strain DSM 9941 / JCM 11954 / NBRC 16129 / PRD-1) TaxID=266117 RepID=Q1ARS7_RUBXD|nr:2-dehydropantoate 2-reductase [Rubrobacter xylanophilus]ABG05901.1 2-dehydropantoate 2-reductase [Rubrobacter xylanophilus DSM 9941]